MPDPQHLYLLRHARAEPWRPGEDDFARPLNAHGIRDMKDLSRWMLHHLPAPDLVLCSPAARTRQTLDPFLAMWSGLDARTQYEAAIYEASASRLHTLADAAFCEADRLMMVGHNPGLECLAQSVLAGRDAARFSKLAPGSLVVVEFSAGWADDAGKGRLQHWLRRKDFGDD